MVNNFCSPYVVQASCMLKLLILHICMLALYRKVLKSMEHISSTKWLLISLNKLLLHVIRTTLHGECKFYTYGSILNLAMPRCASDDRDLEATPAEDQ